jgi:hypothetical protein
MKARVSRYGLWQLRDYLIDRGLPTIIIIALGGYLTLAPAMMVFDRRLATLPARLIEKYGGVEGARAVLMQEMNENFLRGFLGAVVFMGALLAMNGIVANDRKQGFYRFLFSKPLSPSRYYGQAFVVHWAGFLAVMLLMSTVYGFVFAPLPLQGLTIALAIMFLLYAGIAFSLSAAARWDWLSLVTVTAVATYMWQRFAESSSPLAWLLYLLPPLHRTNEIYEAVAARTPLDSGLLAWYAGYGAACYVIGLVILRYRRMAIV